MTDTTPETSPEEIPAPEVPPVRTAIITMRFITTQSDASVTEDESYAAQMERPHGMDAQAYAKQLSEVVERTTMLHLGALPVLQKIDTPTEGAQ